MFGFWGRKSENQDNKKYGKIWKNSHSIFKKVVYTTLWFWLSCPVTPVPGWAAAGPGRGRRVGHRPSPGSRTLALYSCHVAVLARGAVTYLLVTVFKFKSKPRPPAFKFKSRAAGARNRTWQPGSARWLPSQ